MQHDEIKALTTDALFDELASSMAASDAAARKMQAAQIAQHEAIQKLQTFLKPDQIENYINSMAPELKQQVERAQDDMRAAQARRQTAGVEVDRRRMLLDEQLVQLYKGPIVVRT